MPEDVSLIEQLERWLESQVPTNLHDLPYRMLETMERVSNELFETLNINGAPSLSLPFPPFMEKQPPPPPPVRMPTTLYHKSVKVVGEHPYLAGSMALAMTAGLGYSGYAAYNRFTGTTGRRLGSKGLVEDGMLKQAIVLLVPSPSPPILVPLTATLLKAGYIVIVAVPQIKEAEGLERRLSGLEEKSALRVLIYDPEDSTTFPPFQRSLLATLTLRFPSPNASSDPYNPSPTHVPHIHAFVSLYPLNPSPPSQPGALPALPTLLGPDTIGDRQTTLITLYPSTSTLTTPNTFANQLVSNNHHLLGRNLAASYKARIVSVYLGDITLPSLPAIISHSAKVGRREQARLDLRNSAIAASMKVSIVKDYVFGGLTTLWFTIVGRLGIGSASRDYMHFEHKMLRILRSSRFASDRYTIGQRSYLPLVISRAPLPMIPYLLRYLPTLPSSVGPTPPLPSKNLNTSRTQSASSSEHEGDDLASSIHTSSASSKGQEGYESSASGTGLDESWVGLDGHQ